MLQRGWMLVVVAVLAAIALLAQAAPALAFDAGPHAEITNSALDDEGFGDDATSLVEINNWFVDLYARAAENPFSGHGPLKSRFGAGVVKTENWPNDVVAAALRAHFDNEPGASVAGQMPSLKDTAGIQAEWDRLQRAVWTLVLEAREEDDPAKLLTVLGMSLHQIQDFYSHTNWIEAQNATLGTDGPDWQSRGFGSNPTWFDVPAGERDKAMVYADSTPGHSRTHGYWHTDNNTSLTTGMNKDWPGRPLHIPAVETAYFASRQWVQAVRFWVNDAEFWQEAQSYRADQDALEHDRDCMFNISLYTGHWQGQGEPFLGQKMGPGGNLFELRAALKKCFQVSHSQTIGTLISPFTGAGIAFGNPSLRGPSQYRARFERLIKRMAEPSPRGKIGEVPSTQDMQRSTQFVVLRVMELHGEDLGDPATDDADMYARVRIDGSRQMASAVLNGHDNFNFPDPFEPFTWVKAVPKEVDEGEPVESIQVEVKTADVRWAGTNDDVYLRLGPGLQFPLDKRLYNDFESDDRDTYSVPIDDSVRDGMVVGDITRVQLEKESDGIAGGWKLGGVALRVNGRLIYDNQSINRWLEDDHREWRAPDFERRTPHGPKVPIWIRLRDDDYLYGRDDDGDINPYDNRDTVSFGYTLGTLAEATTRGGNALEGRIGYDGDDATITYQVETDIPEPMGQIEPPAPPVRYDAGELPDLVVTDFFFGSVTVTNQGAGPASSFRLSAGNGRSQDDVSFPGLAPGASETRRLHLPCEGFYNAIADDLEQVAETDETNNEAVSEPVIC